MDKAIIEQLVLTVGLGGFMILLVAAWRAMLAHESIARSLREIASKIERR